LWLVCLNHGENRNDALNMIDDAKQLWLETALVKGIEIPEPEVEEHVLGITKYDY
jgi:predicted RNase H-like HicB family nuclease